MICLALSPEIYNILVIAQKRYNSRDSVGNNTNNNVLELHLRLDGILKACCKQHTVEWKRTLHSVTKPWTRMAEDKRPYSSS